jgi:hypothetical protein
MNEGVQITAILLLVVVGILKLLSNARESRKSTLQTGPSINDLKAELALGQRQLAEGSEWLTASKEHGLRSINSSIILKADEAAFYEAPSALYETRAVRYSAGSGFRVGSLSEQEWTQIDVGTLTVTNQRLVFNGAKADSVVPIKELLSANMKSLSKVEVTAEGLQKSMVFDAANPMILATIIGSVCEFAQQQERATADIRTI